MTIFYTYILGWLLGGFTCVSIYIASENYVAYKYYETLKEKARQQKIKDLGSKYSDLED